MAIPSGAITAEVVRQGEDSDLIVYRNRQGCGISEDKVDICKANTSAGGTADSSTGIHPGEGEEAIQEKMPSGTIHLNEFRPE